MEFESFRERDYYILMKCPLGADPPDRKVEDLALCSNTLYIDDCYTGNVHSHYDTKKIEKACKKSSIYLNSYYQDPVSLIKYANVYCYLCNNPNQAETPSMCPTKGARSSNYLYFSAVISEGADDSVEGNGQCKAYEVPDRITVRLLSSS